MLFQCFFIQFPVGCEGFEKIFGAKVEVVSDSQRRFAAWIGGSMFASLSTFDQVAITKQDAEDLASLRE